MRLEQLEFLIHVAETHSMQNAADLLHTTIQNVSKTIKQLENELNVTLFNRTKHGVFLSADGEFVYKEAKNVQQSINNIQQKYSFLVLPDKNELKGNLKILTCAAMSDTVSSISQSLRKKYPDLHIDNIIEDPLNINDYLSNNKTTPDKYDIIITAVNSKEIKKYNSLSDLYHIFFLREDRLGINISDKHPYAKLEAIPLKYLLNMSLIALSTAHSTNSHLLSMVKDEKGVTLLPSMSSNTMEKCNEFIVNGLGYGLMAISDNEPKPGRTVIPLKEKIYVTYLMLIPNYEPLPKQIQIFKNIFRDKFKNTYMRLF